MRAAIVDTGPLVAVFDRGDEQHGWAVHRIAELDPPLLVCEPVLAETMHLIARFSNSQDRLLGMVEKGALRIALHVEDHIVTLRSLIEKYSNVPMSLADACIVRMSEIHDRHAVLTLDSDFTVYRKHSRVPLSLIYPGA
jgi:predicted nucleic acid-binding protein